ncbi:electron transfer flavoprotein subunit beta/FixA family protein [Cyclobacterium xiamenense]|uniref:electron transfer flavoprotein subunit beta/FixA family protein n=1 Tax=Cyclobacterium xiamenense TaxID=1297121 RepID=UPI0035D0FACD
MKILVCITHVPDTTSKIRFTEDNKQLDTTGVQFIIGPYDDYALARAVELKEQTGGSITVVNVGEKETEPTLRKALAIGADEAIRVDAFPSDAVFVARQIAHLAREGAYDLILMGRESIDFNGGMVHGMVGELLGIPSISPVMKLEIEGKAASISREIEGGKEVITVDLPLIAGCQEPIAEWKIPNMRGIMSARTKPLTAVTPIAARGATSVEKYSVPPAKEAVKLVTTVEELVDLLKNDAKIL